MKINRELNFQLIYKLIYKEEELLKVLFYFRRMQTFDCLMKQARTYAADGNLRKALVVLKGTNLNINYVTIIQKDFIMNHRL